ncbi:MAG: glycosyltransferase [Acidimicrobiales bacterium]
MPEELAPPVVAVVVTSDPGEWLEVCLGSLSAQDYPNLTVLVVDDASKAEVTSRVAAVQPAAIVRRRATPGGYAAAANEALTGIEGSSFFLFCHDDVQLDHAAVMRLVEESFRSNAAVVGPKFLDWDNPELLVQVGLGMHRLGTPVPRVQSGELDQLQHDEARDVFAVPGGCTLVRADLFEALHGFDPAMSFFGEDIDFCWRAQIAGARVTIAPQARVQHRQIATSGGRQIGDVTLLKRRHELRAALKNYGAVRRIPVTLELVVLAVGEIAVGMLNGERERARRVARAWRWNLAERQSLSAGRSHLREVRQVPDRVLARRMIGRGRIRHFFRPETPDRPVQSTASPGSGRDASSSRSWWTRVQGGDVPIAQLTAVAVLVVVGVLGTRDLLFGHLPLVGELVPMPRGWTMLGSFLGGLSSGGRVGPAPTAFGLVGLLGLVLGDSSAQAWKAIDLGSVLIGAIGVSRFCRPFLSSRGRLVAATAFVGLPLLWNALATGNVEAAISLGAMPYVFGRLARATGLAPFSSPATERSSPARPTRVSGRDLIGEIVPFGLLLGVLGALAPAGLLAVGVVLLAMVFTCLIWGRLRAAIRALGIFLGALALAVCCCLPWSLTWLEAGSRWSAFSGVVPGSELAPASLLRGHTGPVGAWWGTWGLVIAACYVLLVSRRERLTWATALWLAATGSVALAWAGSRGWLGAGGGASAVLSSPAAVAIAVACGLGMVAFERDVLTSKVLGWRQGAGFVGGICLMVGLFPALSVAIGGRAGMPSAGVDQSLDWLAPARHAGYSVLWLGDPRVLPAAGWQLARGLAWFTTTTGLPGGAEEWPSASPGETARVGAALDAALKARTVDVGSLLSPLGVRYIVVPLADAPDLPGIQTPPVAAPPPEGLISVLQAQGDLIEHPVEAGARVFVNADWVPRDGVASSQRASPRGSSSSALWRTVGLGTGLVAWLGAIAEGVTRRRRWDPGSPSREPSPLVARALRAPRSMR